MERCLTFTMLRASTLGNSIAMALWWMCVHFPKTGSCVSNLFVRSVAPKALSVSLLLESFVLYPL